MQLGRRTFLFHLYAEPRKPTNDCWHLVQVHRMDTRQAWGPVELFSAQAGLLLVAPVLVVRTLL